VRDHGFLGIIGFHGLNAGSWIFRDYWISRINSGDHGFLGIIGIHGLNAGSRIFAG